MFKILIGAAIGAAAAWFLDPNDGTRRRNLARDKATKYARQGKDQAAAAAPGGGREPAEERLNDPALKAKVESEIFRDADAPKGQVSVNVESGIVFLRGEIEDGAEIERLREAAANVDGVRGVENLLQTAGSSSQ
jgi:osmotically-inducible protein OsmY